MTWETTEHGVMAQSIKLSTYHTTIPVSGGNRNGADPRDSVFEGMYETNKHLYDILVM